VRHILFGINVHVNYDLPQALLAVISDEEFDDASVRARGAADHEHIDGVLAARVKAEDRALPDRSPVDRILAPLNHAATKRFLKEARQKVWRNAAALSRARRRCPEEMKARVDELDRLAAARVADLAAPGQVVIKLGLRGFGFLLPGA